MLAVCDALAEAHRNLVVHRDLKPSNLLVTAAGEPRFLDFGIAKELDPLADAAATRTGHQPLTPACASPEQVRGRPVTVATDVYSLGVLLYRLLCGHPPYVLDGDHFENVRTVCEEQPPPPSTRALVAREVWRDGSPAIIPPEETSAARNTDPRTLRRRIEGDLDSIVARALAKDPNDRYRSMEQLAQDLRRHLDGLPVAAHRGDLGYRAVKFLRRHRRRLLAAVLVTAALAIAAAGWLDSQRRERRAAAEAAEAERQAEALTPFARNLVRATDPDASGGRPLTAREILERGRREARRSLAGRPELLAHQLEALGLAYQSLGDLEAARPLLEESLALRRRVYVGDHRLLARGLNNLAALRHVAGDRASAERLYRSALAMKRRLGAFQPRPRAPRPGPTRRGRRRPRRGPGRPARAPRRRSPPHRPHPKRPRQPLLRPRRDRHRRGPLESGPRRPARGEGRRQLGDRRRRESARGTAGSARTLR